MFLETVESMDDRINELVGKIKAGRDPEDRPSFNEALVKREYDS
jgi:hypothetical protein